jgi:hypothetical protein
MRRAPSLVLAVALLALAGPTGALAQDATPVGPAADGATVENLYGFTLPAGAVPAQVGGAVFLRFTVSPGTSFDFSVPCWVSPAADAWYVEAGRFAVRPAAPARLVRSGSGAAAPEEPVAAGQEVVLGPGNLLVYVGLPPVPGEFRNPGPEPVSGLVFGIWGPEVAACPPTGMVEPWLEYLEGAAWTLPPGPLALALRRITLPPGGRVPLPEPAPGEALTFLHTEEGAPTYEGAGAERILTNTRNAPLVVLLLEARPASPGAGTPATRRRPAPAASSTRSATSSRLATP